MQAEGALAEQPWASSSTSPSRSTFFTWNTGFITAPPSRRLSARRVLSLMPGPWWTRRMVTDYAHYYKELQVGLQWQAGGAGFIFEAVGSCGRFCSRAATSSGL